MSDLEKLRPDRDLQCYFERPSAAAALSETGAAGFTVSGCWRQQFDWAVVEWNRDNVFEHPALRNLPDGDLSGLQLSYEETRENAIPLDATWYPTVDWPYLRVWAADTNNNENIYKIPLAAHATAVEGDFRPATATFELQGTPAKDDYVELAWLDEHYTYQLLGADRLEDAAAAIVDSVNRSSATMHASQDGAKITLSYDRSQAGANGNRIGVYGNTTGAEQWSPAWQTLSGGVSPGKWRISLDFSNVQGYAGPDFTQLTTVPTKNVRKMRWTWAADLQAGTFARSEFAVTVSNWSVTGTNRGYQVAGLGSRRIEDDAPEMQYSGAWKEDRGNYSGGSIRYSLTPGSSVTCRYQAGQNNRLYLGTRKAAACGKVQVMVDGGAPQTFDLALPAEDVLVRLAVADLSGQVSHTVTVTHTGQSGQSVYFDFLEAAVPCGSLPVFSPDGETTLATDWDTDHSIALAPERTAWLLHTLGFQGRANHYVGAMWFYELYRPGQQYAAGSITFTGTPKFGGTTAIWLGPTAMTHLNLVGDTAASVAKAFELLINAGSTGVWAHADGGVLTIQSRAMGQAGNALTIAAQTDSADFTATVQGNTAGGVTTLAGGADGTWRTDLSATPRVNRAARDWCRSYYRALAGYGTDAAAAFSMELQHGDDTPAAGIAQRYPDGTPCWVNTPALQTNFSPASTAFWQQVYLDMAQVMAEAGLRPFLQFGEVQWWYFPAPKSGMPFYDAYTTATFQAQFGRALPVFPDGSALPAQFPQECAFLASLIGQFTNTVMAFVRQKYPQARFEVLYPPDVNEAPLNGAVNLPQADWAPAKLDCFKTENFSFTYARDLNKARDSILLPMRLGFPPARSSHLVGIGEYTTPWQRESELSEGEGLESVVLFALDQFCLIGYAWPGNGEMKRSLFMGA